MQEFGKVVKKQESSWMKVGCHLDISDPNLGTSSPKLNTIRRIMLKRSGAPVVIMFLFSEMKPVRECVRRLLCPHNTLSYPTLSVVFIANSFRRSICVTTTASTKDMDVLLGHKETPDYRRGELGAHRQERYALYIKVSQIFDGTCKDHGCWTQSDTGNCGTCCANPYTTRSSTRKGA